ncbi:uncharacterized protein LOC124472824 [Hypomesus transpacificus]|uniref:uncharacterized protein LOC124472824 n=1 Tax=Hypomesus transpacificus TaxID=137520 RepID=UPI001F085A6F|nr:uncharacterized protein LOC124472824 [Hypomesus transpacificus]
MVEETGEERGAAMVEEVGGDEREAVMVDKEGGQMYVNQKRKGEKGGPSSSGERGSSVEGTGAKGLQPIAAPMMHSVQACEGFSSMDWTSVPMDTCKPMEVTPTQPEEWSISGGKFICCVKVRIKKELAPSEASCQEGAVEEAYMSLLQALSLGKTTTPGCERQRVLEFFKQSECVPPVEESDITAERKHRCKLSIMGELSFHSLKGAAKKQQAEHNAAKEALRHLKGLLGGNRQIPDSSENYKGRLQELVIKHGGGVNDIAYHTTENHNTTAAGQVTKESRVVCGSNPRAEGSVKHAVATETTPENRDPPQDERTSKMHSDILTGMKQWLACSGLRDVECEDVTVEQRYEWRVCVGFEGFTLQIRETFGSKKEAIRHAYLRLGLAGQFCHQDELKSKEKMNRFFAKHSFSKPGETVHETKTGPSLTGLSFSCSLTDITCVFTYCGEGSTEAAAHLSAVQKALSCLCPLFGYASLSMDSVVDEHERLRTLLEKENLNLAKSVPERTWFRSSAKLKFKRYSVETEGQQNKRDTKNQLSRRLLRLLGEDTASSNVSPKKTMEEWFVKNKLEKPQFEETDGKFGTRVTFSAPVHCITDWQDRYEETERQLVKELGKKIQYLSDDSSNP